ncbi:MAG: methyltransferase domain-containing protein [Halolamina sp.]
MYCLELAGEDDPFAIREAEAAAVGVERLAPGLGLASHVDTDRLRGLAYTRAADEVVARTEASIDVTGTRGVPVGRRESSTLVDAAELALRAAQFDREGTVAVRARDVQGLTGVDTQAVERRLGGVLVENGYEVDLDTPDHELRALFSAEDGLADPDGSGTAAAERLPSDEGLCVLGWLAAESVRDFGERRPTDRPFFQPGSMAPLDARALANIAGAAPERTILDPMCGTGGTLIEAGLVGAAVVGTDAQWKMVRGTKANLDALVDEDHETAVARADATALPLGEGSIDGVVFDAPYGRQSKIATHRLADLVAGALREAYRVSTAEATCVLMADRSWRAAASEAGWRVTDRFERRAHASLTRHVHVLEKPR